MDIKIIFLSGLTEPEYSRVEFWQNKQKESGFSPIVYWIKLNEVWQYYHDFIETKMKEVNSWGNSITDWRLPLLSETNNLVIGHIGIPELEDLQFSLFHYGFELKQNVWFYEYKMDNIHTSKEYAPSKQFPLFRSINELNFVTELKQMDHQKIDEFLDFHFRCYERKIKNESNFEELQEKWIEHTKKLIPREFSPKQKDVFLMWFEVNERGEIKKVKDDIPAPVIRLFCSLVHQSGIQTRGGEESSGNFCKRVCKDFNLTYTENVRKYFNHESDIKKTDKNLAKVISLILPKLPITEKQKIESIINNKTKLYS